MFVTDRVMAIYTCTCTWGMWHPQKRELYTTAWPHPPDHHFPLLHPYIKQDRSKLHPVFMLSFKTRFTINTYSTSRLIEYLWRRKLWEANTSFFLCYFPPTLHHIHSKRKDWTRIRYLQVWSPRHWQSNQVLPESCSKLQPRQTHTKLGGWAYHTGPPAR